MSLCFLFFFFLRKSMQGIAQRWIEAVLKEKFPPDVTFANALKSGVILCR